jgi:hypothetical protein
MSKTYKTNNARIVRALSREFVDEINNNYLEAADEIQATLKALGIDGARYGNKRKSMAAKKVADRRRERHLENKKLKDFDSMDM